MTAKETAEKQWRKVDWQNIEKMGLVRFHDPAMGVSKDSREAYKSALRARVEEEIEKQARIINLLSRRQSQGNRQQFKMLEWFLKLIDETTPPNQEKP
jgi:hypothetical protein